MMALTLPVALLLILGPVFALMENATHRTTAAHNTSSTETPPTVGHACSVKNESARLIFICKVIGWSKDKLLVNITINECAVPVTIDVNLKKGDGLISNTIQSDERIKVPGSLVLPMGLLKSDVEYIDVKMNIHGSNMLLKVKILTGLEVTGEFFEKQHDVIIDSQFPLATSECTNTRSDFEKEWHDSGNLKYWIIGGCIAVVLLMSCCVCCLCCGCCNVNMCNCNCCRCCLDYS